MAFIIAKYLTNITRLFLLEMVRQSAKVAKRLGHSVRNHAAKRQQIEEDVNLMVDACPNVHKLNLVLHHKLSVLGKKSNH